MFHKNSEKSIASTKNYTKEKLLELLRKADFQDYITYIYVKEAYQDFLYKLSESTDFLCHTKFKKLKVSLKTRIDSETI